MSIKMLYEKDGTTLMGSALNVGYPQTSGGTTLTSGTTYTATSNGWVCVFGNSKGGLSELKVEIDGITVLNINNGGGDNFWSAICVCVRKDQNYKVTYPTSVGGGAKFYPDQTT